MKNYFPAPYSRRLVEYADYDRLSDDGCPHHWFEAEDVKVRGVVSTGHYWADDDGRPKYGGGMCRVYVCSQCSTYVWHPLSYCHLCGGRMRQMKGRTEDLKKYVSANNCSDGGF